MLQEKLMKVEVGSPSSGARKTPAPRASAAPQTAPGGESKEFRDACGMFPEGPTTSSENKSKTARVAPRTRTQAPKGEEVSLIGRIGLYPELKRTQRGTLLATFSVGSERSYKDDSGEWQKKFVWQRIVVWGESAQSVSKRLRSGAQVYVQGRLTTREWTDKQNNKRTSTDLVAQEVRFMDMAQSGTGRHM